MSLYKLIPKYFQDWLMEGYWMNADRECLEFYYLMRCFDEDNYEYLGTHRHQHNYEEFLYFTYYKNNIPKQVHREGKRRRDVFA